MLKFAPFVCLVWSLQFCYLANGQSVYTLNIVENGSSFLKDFAVEKQFPSTSNRKYALEEFIATLWSTGYLSAGLDSVRTDSLHMTAYVFAGEIYAWAKLRPGNVDEEILSASGVRLRLIEEKPLTPERYASVFERLLNWCDNNGFPFARLRLDSLTWNGKAIEAQLDLDKGPLTIIDSLIIKGDANIAPVYLKNYLGIRPGDVYNESLVEEISSRLSELSFLKEIKPAELLFTPGKASIYLYLQKKSANQFNGVVGIQPDNTTGKITVTGDARLKLKNGLGRGELIDFNWRKLRSLTQDLSIHLNYPFLFNTPIGTDYQFKLYKKDTTFLELNQQLGIQYLLSGGNYVQVSLGRKTSSILSLESILSATQLPSYADVSTTNYGIEFKSQRLDYAFNPRNGYSILFSASVGNKSIIRNDSLEELNPGIYDEVALKSTQYQFSGQADYFVPVFKRMVLYWGLNGGFLVNENLFQNEMFRVGGPYNLRGFDTESLLATSYGVATFEYRLLLERNSNLYVFSDWGWYERNETEAYLNDFPLGFGAGIRFETKAGIFDISYALGKQMDNPILIRNAKIHFGFTNLF